MRCVRDYVMEKRERSSSGVEKIGTIGSESGKSDFLFD